LDLEFAKLKKQFISENDALIFLSEELIIMYTRIHMVRRQWVEFVASSKDKVGYMT
jgi:hypothetical protein